MSFGPLVTRAGQGSKAAAAGAFSMVVAGLLGFAGYGVTMSLPSTLAGASAASSTLTVALFTGLAMLGGLVGPAVLGATTERAGGSYTKGGLVLGSLSALAGVVYMLCFQWLVPGGK